MPIINDFLDALGTILSGVVGFFTDALDSVIDVIYTTTDGEGSFTTFGYIFILGVGIGVFWFIFNWIRKLLTLRGR